MKFKEIAQLEDTIFQTMESLYQAKNMLNKNTYSLALSTLEILNAEYETLAGKPFIEESRIIKYHEDKWVIPWN